MPAPNSEPQLVLSALPQRGRPGIPVNCMETKLRQIFDSRKLNGDPAIRFTGEWRDAAPVICAEWIKSAVAHESDAVSHIALCRMKALHYERKHRHQLRPEQRLFPGLRSKRDFHHAQVCAFLEAVGEDPDKVLDSFNYVGQGGLHRKNVNTAWSFKALLTTIRRLVADPITRVALSASELAVEAVVAQQVVASGDVRFRIAQTEEIMPAGKADASPSAKQAPTILKTSHDVIWKLNGADTLVKELFSAVQAAEDARSRYLCTDSCDATALAAARGDLDQARDALELLFARHCYHRQLRAAHKAGVENLKKEFFGNAGYFAASNTVNAMVLTSGLLAILTPAVLSAVVTGGFTAAALGAAVLIYLGYHFSEGPSKDGARKAKRQVLALAKSVDILAQESRPSHQQRAQSYQHYRRALKQARRLPPDQRHPAERDATSAHLARLRDISHAAQADAMPADIGARKNWEHYGRYYKQPDALEPAGRDEQSNAARVQAQAEFEAALQGSFRTEVVSKGWKTPMSMRMDAARRLVKGKIADLHERLLDIESERFSIPRAFKSSAELQRKKEQLGQRLRQAVFDALNLELAAQRMAEAVDEGQAEAAARTSTLSDAVTRSAAALSAVKDEEVHELFCGDAEAQVKITHKAKSMHIGERDRYFYPNLGNAVFALGVGGALGATNTAVTELKMEQKIQLTYNNQEFARILPAGAGVHSPHNASARDEYKNRDALRVVSILSRIARPGLPAPKTHADPAMQIDLENDGRNAFDPSDPHVASEVEAFVERLLVEPTVPESILLLRHPDASGSAVPGHEIRLDLATTEAFYRSRYRTLPTFYGLWGKERLDVAKAKIKVAAKHALVGMGGLVAQPLANFNLRKTRRGFESVAERLPEIERLLQENLQPSPPLSAFPIPLLEDDWAKSVGKAIEAAGKEVSLQDAAATWAEDLLKRGYRIALRKSSAREP